MSHPGFLSLLPLLAALALAFTTRSALLSLFAGVIVGAIMIGGNPAVSLNELFQSALGTGEFIWVSQMVIYIGILTELLKRSGAIGAFASRLSGFADSPRGIRVTTWAMGLLIIDDYFSPLITGTVMRPLTDRVLISREKLAFILDATTASVCVLIPFLSWGAYIVSLIVIQGGPVTDLAAGMSVFVHSIPYNFYSILLVFFTLGIAMQWIPDFGPMRRAEKRATEQGLLLRKGAQPLLAGEANSESKHGSPPYISTAQLVAFLGLPIIIVLSIALLGVFILGTVLIAEAFLTALLYVYTAMIVSGKIRGIVDLTASAVTGITSVLPALLIVALAYSLNEVTRTLGAAEWIVSATRNVLTESSLVAVTFLVSALISFSTGTSWGAFALMIPLALPMAYSFSGGAIAPVVFKTVAAVTGGGIFGDHASPLSDTTVLASMGAGSDHMDHVITQIPYALATAAVSFVLYWLV